MYCYCTSVSTCLFNFPIAFGMNSNHIKNQEERLTYIIIIICICIQENVPPNNIYLTGNTVIDAALWTAKQSPKESTKRLLHSIGYEVGS